MSEDFQAESTKPETTDQAEPTPVFSGRRLVVLMDSLEADPKDSLSVNNVVFIEYA
ncbi:MAG: hypothetical protein ACKO0V_22565 [bacterium]